MTLEKFPIQRNRIKIENRFYDVISFILGLSVIILSTSLSAFSSVPSCERSQGVAGMTQMPVRSTNYNLNATTPTFQYDSIGNTAENPTDVSVRYLVTMNSGAPNARVGRTTNPTGVNPWTGVTYYGFQLNSNSANATPRYTFNATFSKPVYGLGFYIKDVDVSSGVETITDVRILDSNGNIIPITRVSVPVITSDTGNKAFRGSNVFDYGPRGFQADLSGGNLSINNSNAYIYFQLSPTQDVASLSIDFGGGGVLFSPESFNLPCMNKSISPSSQRVGLASQLTFGINKNRPTGTTANLIGFTDTFPANLIIASPANVTQSPSGCLASSSITAVPGTGVFSLANGVLDPVVGSCEISVDVTSNSLASYTNGPANFSGITALDLSPLTDTMVSFLPPPSVVLQKSCEAPANCSTTVQTPGTELTYRINFTNVGGVDAKNLVIVDKIPDSTEFQLGSAIATVGTTGLTFTIQYSDNFDPLDPNNPATNWSYTPTSGAGGATAGYDGNVKAIKWVANTSSDLPANSPNNTGYVLFTVKIK